MSTQPPLRWRLSTDHLVISKILPSIYDRIKLLCPVFSLALVTWAVKKPERASLGAHKQKVTGLIPEGATTFFSLVVCTVATLKRLTKVHKLGKNKRRLYENVIIPLKERFCVSLNVKNRVDEVGPTH